MFTINLEYPVRAVPRYGQGKPSHARIREIIDSRRAVYAQTVSQLKQHAPALSALPLQRNPLAIDQPYWQNDFLSGLDVAVLYHFLVTGNPGHYIEIGSGNSTMVAKRAIRDSGLRTRITSIDPSPRAEINALCDEVIRQPFEELGDLRAFSSLSEGDIVFLDGSHRVFMNSDVTAFFLDVLPNLPKGILVHIHDIFLPDDYPAAWVDRYYSEQYLVACYLLPNGPSSFEIVMPNYFVSKDPQLSSAIRSFWSKVGIDGINPFGCSFWLRTRETTPPA